MKTMSASKNLKVGLLVVALILVFAAMLAPVLFKQRRQKHDQAMTSSCANHSSQLRMITSMFRGQQFPSESDARIAFAKMIEADDQHSTKWLSSAGAPCPEAFNRDGSIGYIYVGDGLTTKIAEDQSALLFFCPADSHQGSDQHCHALLGNHERICLKSNTEMMDLLRRAIRQAKGGIVLYSTNALSRMERELEARQRHETKRRR